ncbi:hypothetical protein VTN31DRAFT_6857 [Thermomyces dupontii]|uniref:uncharacterized protein n=1 Tax=Talaromyces thermophilus TaxID=28565 RepID=UPI0037447D6E
MQQKQIPFRRDHPSKWTNGFFATVFNLNWRSAASCISIASSARYSAQHACFERVNSADPPAAATFSRSPRLSANHDRILHSRKQLWKPLRGPRKHRVWLAPHMETKNSRG